jgi:hypothetical protein
MVFFQLAGELQAGDWVVHGSAGVFMLVGCVCLAEHGRLAFMLEVVHSRISRSNTPSFPTTINAIHGSQGGQVSQVAAPEAGKLARGERADDLRTYSYSQSTTDVSELPAEQLSFTPIASV